MRKVNLVFAALVAAGLFVGCGDEAAQSDDAQIEADGKADGLGSTSTYYTVRRDLRRCISPACGGYWVKKVNVASTRCYDGSSAAECYVTAIDWSALALDNAEQGLLSSATERGAAVLRGRLTPGPLFGGRRLGDFAATEGWEAASDAAPTGTFYKVTDNGIRCITTPCFSLHEAKLSSTWSQSLSAVDSTVQPTSAGVIYAGINRSEPVGPSRGTRLVASQAYTRAVHVEVPCEALSPFPALSPSPMPSPSPSISPCSADSRCEVYPSGCTGPSCVPDGEGGVVCHPCDPILACRAKPKACPPNNKLCIRGYQYDSTPGVCACVPVDPCAGVRCQTGASCHVDSAGQAVCGSQCDSVRCISGTHCVVVGNAVSCQPDGACQTDADCRLADDYCTGCDCRALGPGQSLSICAGPGVRCFREPCGGLTARCDNSRCVAR